MLRKKPQTDTRAKIMEAAFELFGRYGFDGTSIRQIAEKASVNTAAINYHFRSKEGLFWEIMVQTFIELEAQVKLFYDESRSLQELSLKTFDYFLEESYVLKNTMKMMLMEGIPLPDHPEQLAVINNPMGPPGGQYFAEAVQKEIPYPLNREGLFFGIKSSFGNVFHWSFMCCSESCLEEGPNADPLMTIEQIRKDVGYLIESGLDFIKKNPARYKA